MKEVTGNLWTYPADARVITTNGTVTKAGECVMGRGCALEAKRRYPGMAKSLGFLIRQLGNHSYYLGNYPEIGPLYSFPVKHHWYEQADLQLIAQSAGELVSEIDRCAREGVILQTIVIPRPGCGNGLLSWDWVKPVLEPLLDDRFHVITF